MLFSSILFLFTFLPVTLILYYLVPGKLKNVVLLAASLVFYAWGEPVYIFLMIFSILFNYISGLDVARNLGNAGKARKSIIFNIVVNMCILGFFKYEGFLLGSLNAILPVDIPYRELPLPIGVLCDRRVPGKCPGAEKSSGFRPLCDHVPPADRRPYREIRGYRPAASQQENGLG